VFGADALIEIDNNGYDDLARLTSDNCDSAWSQSFSYDAFGNIGKSGTISFQPTYNSAINHYATLPGGTPAYEANGNLTNDGFYTYKSFYHGEVSPAQKCANNQISAPAPNYGSGGGGGTPPKTATAPNGQRYTCPGQDFAYYGNWGGPGWSGGQTVPLETLTLQQQAALKPPIDAQDTAYQGHDYCYSATRVANHQTATCQGLTGGAAQGAATCDLQLEKNLLTVPLNVHTVGSLLLFPVHAAINMYQGAVSLYPYAFVGIP
jgi:YD repeat-containing protein